MFRRFDEWKGTMGSIFNLLNPLTSPSPAPTSPQQARKPEPEKGEGESGDVTVTVDAAEECSTPVESDEKRVTGIGQQSNEDKVVDNLRPGITAEGVNASS